MPYAIRKRGSCYEVYNKETGRRKGCHKTRAKAVKHLRALYWATSGERETKRKRRKRKK